MKKTIYSLFTFLIFFAGILFFNQNVSAEVIPINETTFPDAALRNAVADYKNSPQGMFNTTPTEDGYIETNDIKELNIIEFYGTVTSLEGLEVFKNLTYLSIQKFSGSELTLTNNFQNAAPMKSITIWQSTAESVTINIPNAACDFSLHSNGTKNITISAPNVTAFYLCGYSYVHPLTGLNTFTDINTLTGVNTLTNINKLSLHDTNITSLDLSNCKKIKELSIDSRKLESVTGLEQLSELQSLSIVGGSVKNLDLTANTKLLSVYCISNLTTLKVPASIEEISCEDNNLKTIDLSKCKNLTFLDLAYNNINGKKLNLKKCTKLKFLHLNNNKKLNTVDISKNKQLYDLNISNTNLKTLKLTNNKMLNTLYADNTNLKTLNLNNIKKLKHIRFFDTKIKKLDLTKYNNLYLYFDTKVGKTIKLENYLGTGYQCIKTDPNIRYNTTDNSVKIIGNEMNSNGDSDSSSITLKKNNKKYTICFTID